MFLYIAQFLLNFCTNSKDVTFCIKTQRDVTLFLFDLGLTLTKYLFGKRKVFVWKKKRSVCLVIFA